MFEIECSDDSRLDKAKEMINRIKNRDYYKFVGEIVLPSNMG